MTLPLLAHLDRLAELAAHDGAILVALDFDGTLCPLAPSPALVRVPVENIDLLRELAGMTRVRLAVISGRALEDVRQRLPGVPAVFAGNHGFEISGAGIEYRHPDAARLERLVLDACRSLDDVVKRWSGAWVENKGLTATMHFRNVDGRHQHAAVLAARAAMASFGAQIGLRAGKKALEIHPRAGWDKGAALDYIRARMQPQPAACLCMGDDRTDETMFAAAAPAITVRVGAPARTRAAYHLASEADVTVVLGHLRAEIREADAGVTAAARATPRTRDRRRDCAG